MFIKLFITSRFFKKKKTFSLHNVTFIFQINRDSIWILNIKCYFFKKKVYVQFIMSLPTQIHFL